MYKINSGGSLAVIIPMAWDGKKWVAIKERRLLDDLCWHLINYLVETMIMNNIIQTKLNDMFCLKTDLIPEHYYHEPEQPIAAETWAGELAQNLFSASPGL